MQRIALIIGWLTLLAGSVSAAPRTFTIDAKVSAATAHVGKTGIGSFAGHEHNVVARDVQGEIMLDAEKLSESAVDLIIPTRSLTVSPEGEPDGDAPKVEQAMRGPSVLDVARFSTIHFGSTEVKGSPKEPGKYALEVTGEMTLHGVTKVVKLPIQLEVKGDLATASGKLTVKQTDYGIEPTTVAGGLVKVENEVVLAFKLVARAAP